MLSSTGTTYTRVAVVQLAYHPAALVDRRSPLEDPMFDPKGGPDPLLPRGGVPDALAAELRARIRNAHNDQLANDAPSVDLFEGGHVRPVMRSWRSAARPSCSARLRLDMTFKPVGIPGGQLPFEPFGLRSQPALNEVQKLKGELDEFTQRVGRAFEEEQPE